MWFDQEPFSSGQSWSALWHGFVICNCGAIRQPVQACPSCGIGPDGQDLVAKADGREVMISVAQMGAEGSYEDYIFLEMLQREWERPVVEFSRFDGLKPGERPSARAALILLFWTYFEAKN